MCVLCQKLRLAFFERQVLLNVTGAQNRGRSSLKGRTKPLPCVFLGARFLSTDHLEVIVALSHSVRVLCAFPRMQRNCVGMPWHHCSGPTQGACSSEPMTNIEATTSTPATTTVPETTTCVGGTILVWSPVVGFCRVSCCTGLTACPWSFVPFAHSDRFVGTK